MGVVLDFSIYAYRAWIIGTIMVCGDGLPKGLVSSDFFGNFSEFLPHFHRLPTRCSGKHGRKRRSLISGGGIGYLWSEETWETIPLDICGPVRSFSVVWRSGAVDYKGEGINPKYGSIPFCKKMSA